MAADTHFGLDPQQPGWAEEATAAMSRAERLLTACAWCERVKVEEDWVSADVAIRTLRTFEWPEPPLFTHGMCEDCLAFLTGARNAADGAPQSQ